MKAALKPDDQRNRGAEACEGPPMLPHTHLKTTSMEDALSATSAVLRSVEGGDARAFLLSAFIDDEALVLGRFQRAEDTLFDASTRHLVRRTGGPAWRASTGALYVALVLSSRDAITPTPPGKVLNRNLRGLIPMGRALGAPFVYGGRELLSVGGHAVGLVSHGKTLGGAVLVECLIGVHEPVLPRADQVDDAWVGPRWPLPWSSLKERGLTTSEGAIVGALLASHEAWVGAPLLPKEVECHHGDTIAREDEAGLVWSRLIGVPAGVVTVGVDAARIHVRGDVMQDEGADATLSKAWCALRNARAALALAYPEGLAGVPLEALAMLIEEVAG